MTIIHIKSMLCITGQPSRHLVETDDDDVTSKAMYDDSIIVVYFLDDETLDEQRELARRLNRVRLSENTSDICDTTSKL